MFRSPFCFTVFRDERRVVVLVSLLPAAALPGELMRLVRAAVIEHGVAEHLNAGGLAFSRHLFCGGIGAGGNESYDG